MPITLYSARPAGSRRAVMFCCDAGYLPYAALAAVQIATLHPDRDFDICLCSSESDLVLPDSLASYGFRLCHIEIPGVFTGLRLDAGRTDVVYLRLAVPEAFAGEYDRILYLDSDIFVQGGDFQSLLSVDLGARPIAAIRDNSQWRSPDRRPEQFRRLGLPWARYFNAGVMLIDVARFTELRVMERCIELGRANAERMIRHDQNLLNAVLHGDWAELSPVWNWQYAWSSRMFETMVGAHVLHFIGPAKPWNDPEGRNPPRFRRAFNDFARTHFPQVVPNGAEAAPFDDPAYLRKSLLKHLLATPRMAEYLRRFPDPLTVHP